MAQPAWKRPGSPIGKKGPRKTNPEYKRRSRQRWSDKEVKQLRSLAKANTPTGVISLKMERPPASIASKAQREGISLRPANRSPYNRRKPAKKGRRQFRAGGLSSRTTCVGFFEAVSIWN